VTRVLSPEDVAERRRPVLEVIRRVQVVEIDRVVLARASDARTVALGALDAIPVATALERRESFDEPVAFATHEITLASAPLSYGFEAIGAGSRVRGAILCA
jgi:hypothetical protein